MARKKITIAYIAKGAHRRATFMKRRRGLLKKVEELATLCDVKACAVIHEPDMHQTEVWPNEQETRRVLQSFMDMPPNVQSKNMLSQEGYLREQISKLEAKICRITNENHQLEMAVLMNDGLAGKSLHGLSMDKIMDLRQYLDNTKMMIQQRMKAAAADAGMRENAVMANDLMPAQQTNWGPMIPTPTATPTATPTPTATATNGQMFFGSSSSSSSTGRGMEENIMQQPYMNIGTSWMHFPFY